MPALWPRAGSRCGHARGSRPPRMTCYIVWRIRRKSLCHGARLATTACLSARCSEHRVWRALVAIVNSNLSVGWYSLRFSWSYGPFREWATCGLSRRCTGRIGSADRRSVIETTMGSGEVVVVQPGLEVLVALLGVGPMANVSPFA